MLSSGLDISQHPIEIDSVLGSFAGCTQSSDLQHDAALDEFVAKGYEQASINAILQTAGMSKGQFYYHFGNKEGLYLAIAGVLIEEKKAFLASVMKPDDLQQDLFGLLRTQIQYSLAFAREYPDIDRFSQSFIREKGTAIYSKALSVYNFEDNDAIEQLIDRAYQNGELRDDLPRHFVRRVVGYMFTHAVDILNLDDPDTVEQDMLDLIEFLKSGLARQSE